MFVLKKKDEKTMTNWNFDWECVQRGGISLPITNSNIELLFWDWLVFNFVSIKWFISNHTSQPRGLKNWIQPKINQISVWNHFLKKKLLWMWNDALSNLNFKSKKLRNQKKRMLFNDSKKLRKKKEEMGIIKQLSN